MANQNTNPVTDEERAEIRRLHAEGKGRNEISRIIGRSLRTISVQAAKMNLSFDRTMTEEATRARKADLEERRVILAEALHTDAEELTERLWQKYRVFNGTPPRRRGGPLLTRPGTLPVRAGPCVGRPSFSGTCPLRLVTASSPRCRPNC
ncbi:helix-turn-helix domain-containing protein [Streptomyces sp. JNUCC 63]